MAILRYYSSIATPTQLTGSISNSSTSITVGSTTGFPSSFPYTLAIDYGGALNELVDVTAAAGLTLTVTRGVDGTSAISHSVGATVRHVASARDFSDYQNHQNATTAHGVAGVLVGTTDTQTLTNKTLNGGTLNGSFAGSPSIIGNLSVGGTLGVTGATTLTSGTFTGALTGDTAGTLRLNNVTDVSLASTGHAFQIGPSSGANLRMDGNEIMGVNNGATAILEMQTDGGTLRTFSSDSSVSSTSLLDVRGRAAVQGPNTGAIDHLSVNAPSGASTSANLLNLQMNSGNRFGVRSTGHVSVNTSGNTAGVPLNVIAEAGQAASLLVMQVAASPQFTVTAAGNVSSAGSITAGTGLTAGTTVTAGTTFRGPLETTVSGFTLAYSAGWAQSSIVFRRWGQFLTFSVNVERTGGNITANAVGNLTDSDVFTVPVGYRPVQAIYGLYDNATNHGGAFLSNVTGICSIRNGFPTSVIATNDIIGFTFTYVID